MKQRGMEEEKEKKREGKRTYLCILENKRYEK